MLFFCNLDQSFQLLVKVVVRGANACESFLKIYFELVESVRVYMT